VATPEIDRIAQPLAHRASLNGAFHMGLLHALFGRTPRQTDEPPDFDVKVGNIRLNKDTLDPRIYREIQHQLATQGHVDLAVTLPDTDDDQTVASEPSHEQIIDDTEPVEPVFCTIDYVDAAGNASRRRITTRSVKPAGSRSIIAAICHERKALRHFRVDRISRIVTFDGEIFDATTFVKDVLAVDAGDGIETGRKWPTTSTRTGHVNFRSYTKPSVLILTAMPMSDAPPLRSAPVQAWLPRPEGAC